MRTWFHSAEDLIAAQRRVAAEAPEPWSGVARSVAGCFVCFSRGEAGGGLGGEPGWAAAASMQDGEGVAVSRVRGRAGASYEPGLLALREGPLLEAAVLALPGVPELLLVNATGRDHPRRAGLALHLGARLGLPTIGVTNRCMQASGDWPADERGATSPLRLEGEIVGYWLRMRRGSRPVAVHAAWRTDPERAAAAVFAATRRSRTPEPLRAARRAAREARSAAGGGT